MVAPKWTDKISNELICGTIFGVAMFYIFIMLIYGIVPGFRYIMDKNYLGIILILFGVGVIIFYSSLTSLCSRSLNPIL